MKHCLKIIKRIRRILDWIPVLWNDEDYDYKFALEILHYKLTRMKNCIVSNNIIADAEKVGNEIDEVTSNLRQILDSSFDNEWWEHYQQTHDVDNWDDPDRRSCVDCNFLLDVAAVREKIAWHSVWNSIQKNMKGWWD